MKKTAMFLLGLSIWLVASAQAELQTRKFIISDFAEKKLKVVLTGNDFFDIALKSGVQDLWNISSYEFCSAEETEKLPNPQDFYFLMVVNSRFRNDAEAGIRMLSIYKGKEAGISAPDRMYKVAAIPLAGAGESDGRELTFLAPLISILQNQVRTFMDTAFSPSSTVQAPKSKFRAACLQEILIAEEDLDFVPDDGLRSICRDAGIILCGHNDIDEALAGKLEGKTVGYVVAPSEGQGTVEYLMLVGTGDWDLHFIRRKYLAPGKPAGFSSRELDAILKQKSKQ